MLTHMSPFLPLSPNKVHSQVCLGRILRASIQLNTTLFSAKLFVDINNPFLAINLAFNKLRFESGENISLNNLARLVTYVGYPTNSASGMPSQPCRGWSTYPRPDQPASSLSKAAKNHLDQFLRFIAAVNQSTCGADFCCGGRADEKFFPPPPLVPLSRPRGAAPISGLVFKERLMRLRSRSSSRTVAITFWPTFTTSEGAFTNWSLSWLMCASPSW